MNPKRLVLAIVAVFVGIFLTDFLIHGVWLQSDYKATASLWRPEAEMPSYMGWLILGQLFFTIPFVVLWAKGFAAKGCIRDACVYGVLLALACQSTTPICYATQPMPGSIMVKWFVSSLAQGVMAGIIVFLVYQPKPTVAS